MDVGYQSELKRTWGEGSQAIAMAFYRIERTEENLRLAEEELDQNPWGFTEDRIAEERKTLEWVRQEMAKERQAQEEQINEEK